MLKKSNFNKYPEVKVHGHACLIGWQNIVTKLLEIQRSKNLEKTIVTIECYHGVYIDELINQVKEYLPSALFFDAGVAMKSPAEIDTLVYPFVTDDPVFGYMAPLLLNDFFDEEKLQSMQSELMSAEKELIIVYGVGATLVHNDA